MNCISGLRNIVKVGIFVVELIIGAIRANVLPVKTNTPSLNCKINLFPINATIVIKVAEATGRNKVYTNLIDRAIGYYGNRKGVQLSANGLCNPTFCRISYGKWRLSVVAIK